MDSIGYDVISIFIEIALYVSKLISQANNGYVDIATTFY